MKLMKKVLALALSLIMVLAMGVTVFADGGYTITVKGDSGHKYEAYQVFTGDLSGNTLSNIKWGSGVNGTNLLAALKTDATIGSSFKDIADDQYAAANVADILTGKTDDSEFVQAFAKVAGANLSTAAGTSEETANTPADGKSSYAISGLAAGYYLVKDQDKSAPSDDAYTRYILKVVNDVEVNAKVDVPTIDKKIVEGQNKVSANTASIGDNVPFELTTKVPDMTGYTKYYFIVNDELSSGLTFNNDVTITVGGTEYTSDKYTVSEENGKIKIVFKNFVNQGLTKGAEIKINYSATVNENAVITDAGNPNTVKLTYSNNPNITPDGENEPGPNDKDVTGETPESKTVTYVTAVKLTKVDATDKTKTLTGAKFRISGDKVNVTVINSQVFEKADNGTYYMLKDGTYTTEEPTEQTAAEYDSTTQKYAKVDKVTQETSKETVTAEAYVDGSGVLVFKGLGAGEYTITELVAPDGYNLLKNPIKVVITADPTMTAPGWSVTADNKTVAQDKTEWVFPITVENNQGAVLPSTGGMGTTIFYAVGAILVLGAAVVLVTRRRMSK